MASFTFVREVASPPEVLFDVLSDHRGYARITALRKSELEREGDPPPNGAGAIRALHLIGPPLREEVLTFEPPRRFSYRVLSGLPVRDHVGTIELTPNGAGTRLTYAVRLLPTVPLAGAALVGIIKLAVKSLIDGAAREAEHRSSGLNG